MSDLTPTSINLFRNKFTQGAALDPSVQTAQLGNVQKDVTEFTGSTKAAKSDVDTASKMRSAKAPADPTAATRGNGPGSTAKSSDESAVSSNSGDAAAAGQQQPASAEQTGISGFNLKPPDLKDGEVGQGLLKDKQAALNAASTPLPGESPADHSSRVQMTAAAAAQVAAIQAAGPAIGESNEAFNARIQNLTAAAAQAIGGGAAFNPGAAASGTAQSANAQATANGQTNGGGSAGIGGGLGGNSAAGSTNPAGANNGWGAPTNDGPNLQPLPGESQADFQSRRQLVLSDENQARTIYAQINADRQRAFYKMLEIIQNARMDMWNTLQGIMINKAKAVETANCNFSKYLNM